jgi:ABC-2 type transport system permease protein
MCLRRQVRIQSQDAPPDWRLMSRTTLNVEKALRATPLRPCTILTAHVVVRLIFTLGLMAALGRRCYPAGAEFPVVWFTLALLFSIVCVISRGFLIASVVPTARFAHPVATFVVYPMLTLSGCFSGSTIAAVRAGVRPGEGWLAHATDVGVMLLMLAVFVVVSAKVFRWE